MGYTLGENREMPSYQQIRNFHLRALLKEAPAQPPSKHGSAALL